MFVSVPLLGIGLSFLRLCANILTHSMAIISTHPTVQQLVALMQAHGITRCVLCPGSRNAPISATLSAMEGMSCRLVTDERSAGFVALGWALQAQAPVAVCVTSGSALLNLHPAAAEAYYRHAPLLIISADRPAAWIGQQDGQTLPQPNALGAMVKKSFNLPEGDTDGWHTNRLINEALLELRHHGSGPVHLNIALAEPLFDMQEAVLPPARVIRRVSAAHLPQELLQQVRDLPRRMILVGQCTADNSIPAQLPFAVVGEHLSNTTRTCTRPDTLLQHTPEAERAALAPDLLITVGGCVVSKALKVFLRKNPPKQHWHISEDGEVCDTFCCQTYCIEGSPDELWPQLSGIPAADTDFLQRWQEEPAVFHGPYCGISVVGAVMRRLPQNSVLHLGNSSAVRFAQLFPLPAGVHVECNRGVNGIEGCVSASMGFALADEERLQVLLCGDLSFFYDMNALWQGDIPPRVRILMLNNGEGGIFATIPNAPGIPCVVAPHRTSAQAWAESCGFRYLPIRHTEDAAAAIDELLAEDSSQPILAEAFTDAQVDADLLRRFYQHPAH